MTNIYRKQMKELNLNASQYAKFLGMPYEVVRDILLNKEGKYSMEIRNLFRKNMIEKHQEVEENKENAKLKVLAEKQNDKFYLDWYNDEYTVDLLKEATEVKTIKEFYRSYAIIINGKKASMWFYSCIVGKISYDKHEVRESVLIEFAKQLYDIIVNRNKEKYLVNTLEDLRKARINGDTEEIKRLENEHFEKTIINKNNKYEKWFKDFDIKKFLNENNLTNLVIAKELNIPYSTFCLMTTTKGKRQYSIKNIEKLYNYVQEKEYQDNAKEYLERQDDNNTSLDNLTSDIIDNSTRQVVSDNDKDALLRKILISRLTEEEKELIRLFGGKIC